MALWIMGSGLQIHRNEFYEICVGPQIPSISKFLTEEADGWHFNSPNRYNYAAAIFLNYTASDIHTLLNELLLF